MCVFLVGLYVDEKMIDEEVEVLIELWKSQSVLFRLLIATVAIVAVAATAAW